jgi:hypothetical protein
MAVMKILYSSYLQKPTRVRFDGEDKDEYVILVLRRHLITNLVWIFMGLFMICIPTLLVNLLESSNVTLITSLPRTYRFMLVAFWYLFTFGYIFTSFLRWFFNAYLVTNKRVVDIDFESLVHRRFSEAFLYNVEDLTHQISGALQVIFNYGTLHIQTAGETRELEFESIPQPATVQDMISDLSSAKRGRKVHND